MLGAIFFISLLIGLTVVASSEKAKGVLEVLESNSHS